MNSLLPCLAIWYLIWIGGWLVLRSAPGGLDLLDRLLYLATDKTKTVLVFTLIILASLFPILLIHKAFFGYTNLFNLELKGINPPLFVLSALLLAANIFLLKGEANQRKFSSAILGFGMGQSGLRQKR